MFSVNKKLVLRFILTIFIVFTLVFIWSNSLENADESSDKSGKVIEVVKPIIDPQDKIDDDLFVNIVRKLAHFSEFALLGTEAFMFALTFRRKDGSVLPFAAASVGGAYLCAVTDELLQLTSDGRSCEFLDTIIDLSGIITGVLAVLAVRWVVKIIKKKNVYR